MRFDVKVTQTGAGDWEVAIRGGNKEWRHSLQGGVDERQRRFPWLPPAPNGQPAALENPAPADIHRALGVDSFTVALNNLYRRPLQPSDLGEKFGRYLFQNLLGDDVWNECCTLAEADGRVDLLLHLADAGPDFARLPWELMRGPTYFPAGAARPAIIPEYYLAEATKPAFTLARDVGKSAWPPAKDVAIAPRVLFVIGQPLTDVEIRAGSEFIGLLNGLEHDGLAFYYRVLLSASLKSLEATIKDFKPSIIHFICHGGSTNEGGFLNLTRNGSADVVACKIEQIFPHLQEGPASIVVLNACWTGGAPFTERALPVAEQLVELGIPIVVGMAGKVADGACRLFTLSFYKALLMGSSVTEAAALGRRAGLLYSPGVAKRIDWAMPTIFLAPGVAPEISIPEEVRQSCSVRHQIAKGICDQQNPRAFCDRLDLVEESYPLLMERASGKQVLAVMVQEKEKADDKTKPNPKFGKSRALKQLAAKAVREGHLACLVELTEETSNKPADLLNLAWSFYEKLRDRGEAYRIACKASESAVNKLWRWSVSPEGVELPAKLREEIDAFLGPTHRKDEVPFSGRVVGTALLLDLVAVLEAATPFLKEVEQRKVLLLLDNAHLLPEACAKAFVDELLKPELPLLADRRVRMALSFSTQVADVHEQSAQKLQNFFGKKPPHTLQGSLGRFAPPASDPFPYCQFFLHYDLPRAVLSENLADADFATKLKDFYTDLHKEVDGIPSRLETPNYQIDYLVLVYSRPYSQVLVEADNDKMLSQFLQPSGRQPARE